MNKSLSDKLHLKYKYYSSYTYIMCALYIYIYPHWLFSSVFNYMYMCASVCGDVSVTAVDRSG